MYPRNLTSCVLNLLFDLFTYKALFFSFSSILCTCLQCISKSSEYIKISLKYVITKSSRYSLVNVVDQSLKDGWDVLEPK